MKAYSFFGMFAHLFYAFTIHGCIEKGYLRKIEPDLKIIEKELSEANYDLERAKHAFDEKDFKWCIIKSYYCMFHAARAVLFSLGLKEKRHFAVQVVLEDLIKKGKLESIYLDYFLSYRVWTTMKKLGNLPIYPKLP